MSEEENGSSQSGDSERIREALDQLEDREYSTFREFWTYMKVTKNWWLAPILLVLFLVGAVVILGETAVGPFIYALF